MKKIKTELFVVFVVISLIPFCGSVIINYFSVTDLFQERLSAKLENTGRMKQASLTRLLENVTHLAGAVGKSLPLKQLQVAKGDQTAPLTEEEKKRLYKAASDAIHVFQEEYWGMFHHIFIADPNGKVIVSPSHGSSTGNHLNMDISESPFFKAALTSVQVTDYFGFQESDHFHQLYLLPLKNQRQETYGVMVMEVCIDYVMKTLNENVDMGEGGEIFLLTLDKRKVLEKKDNKAEYINNPLVEEALNNRYSSGNYTNQAGEDILAVYINDPGRPWIVGLEVKKSVALAFMNSFLYKSLVFLLLLVGLLVLLWLRISKSVTQPIYQIVEAVDRIAEGDFTAKIDIQRQDELGDLVDSINRMIKDLARLIKDIISHSTGMLTSAHQVCEESAALAASTNQEASSVAATTESIDGFAALVENYSANSKESSDSLQGFRENIQSSSDLIGNVTETMQMIDSSSRQIDQIIEVVNAISFQTNLLALNAAVEAARAGDAGRGFAVVASEVRNLAGKTAESSKNIQDIVTNNVESAAKGMKLANETTEFFASIVEKIQTISNQIKEMADSSEQQTEEIQRINHSCAQLEKAVSENVASARTLADEGVHLKKDAESMIAIVKKFKI
ncbi:MAG: methyl-accepting chemotaxis protein [bacterium]|nr:methyl-accepting chemotaxis protein [bacterium]